MTARLCLFHRRRTTGLYINRDICPNWKGDLYRCIRRYISKLFRSQGDAISHCASPVATRSTLDQVLPDSSRKATEAGRISDPMGGIPGARSERTRER